MSMLTILSRKALSGYSGLSGKIPGYGRVYSTFEGGFNPADSELISWARTEEYERKKRLPIRPKISIFIIVEN